MDGCGSRLVVRRSSTVSRMCRGRSATVGPGGAERGPVSVRDRSVCGTPANVDPPARRRVLRGSVTVASSSFRHSTAPTRAPVALPRPRAERGAGVRSRLLRMPKRSGRRRLGGDSCRRGWETAEHASVPVHRSARVAFVTSRVALPSLQCAAMMWGPTAVHAAAHAQDTPLRLPRGLGAGMIVQRSRRQRIASVRGLHRAVASGHGAERSPTATHARLDVHETPKGSPWARQPNHRVPTCGASCATSTHAT
jgi:hypothetical protein